MAGPLKGIRVLDLSRVLAGPWASQVLADLGASVIKIEKPGAGDDTRAWGPPYLKDKKGRETSESAYFLSANRGKRSAAIDIAKKEGAEAVRALARRADILLENFRVGGLKRYRLDYASLRKINPRLIFCSITGFGQTGPRRDQPGYDFMIQGMGGLMSITGTETSGPLKVGVAIADISTGLYAAIAILGALHARANTGKGQRIDMALLDVQASWLANQAMNYLVSGKPPKRRGNAHPNIVPYQTFATKDGHIIVAVGNNDQFARLAKVLGKPDLASNPAYATNRKRVENREGLAAILAKAFRAKPKAAWLAALERAKIPAGPINDLAEVFADPQVKARGVVKRLKHPLAGTVPQVTTPIHFSETPLEYRLPPPLLGQHTDEVLREAGYSKAAIAKLRLKGAAA
jgi:glutaryl-CoA transferase